MISLCCRARIRATYSSGFMGTTMSGMTPHSSVSVMSCSRWMHRPLGR